MFVDRDSQQREPEQQVTRSEEEQIARILGHVTQCDGGHATIVTTSAGGQSHGDGNWSVGRFISIALKTSRVVGLVHDVRVETAWKEDGDNRLLISVELIGEVRDRDGQPFFDRGITEYPTIGAISHRIRQRDLAAVYALGRRDTVAIGTLAQDSAITAHVAMNRMLNRHFAVVGSTGVGKSTAVSLLLHKALSVRPNLRVMILDPHNEFSSAFGDKCNALDIEGLDLPFWMFRLEELVEVIYRGREWVSEEVDVLRDIIPIAKSQYQGANSPSLLRSVEQTAYTADTPVPYRLADLMQIIDDRMGLLESKDMRPVYRAVRQRLDAAIRDPRFRFMFGARIVEDNITAAVSRIFRIPTHGRPVTCLQLAGMPSEVVNSVCSVLARLAFDICQFGKGSFELLLLCEEAHRYMPADQRLGFAPTRHALARIAKEGRKYGCYLGVVTQRPGELDQTILSQCSTIFAMRLANESDQAIIRAAIADSSASTLSFLSSMGQREAIAFGDAVAATMRLKFETLDTKLIPGSSVREDEIGTVAAPDINLSAILERLRNGGRDPAEEDRMLLGRPAPAMTAPGVEQRPSLARLVPDMDDSAKLRRRIDGRLFGHSERD